MMIEAMDHLREVGGVEVALEGAAVALAAVALEVVEEEVAVEEEQAS